MSRAPRLEPLEARVTPATFIVSNTLSGDVPGSLARAILDANQSPDFDTIVFDPNVFGVGKETRIVLTEELPTIQHKMRIQGVSDVRLSIERADTAPDFRIFTTQLGSFVELSDLRIANGRAEFGGGILNNGFLSLERTTIEFNAAIGVEGSGAGIFSTGLQLFVVDSIIRGNAAGLEGVGGGIVVIEGGGLFIDGSTISGNQAALGGGLFIQSGQQFLHFTNTTISGNVATSPDGIGGGAIFLVSEFNDLTLRLVSSTVAFNQAGGLSGVGGIVITGFNNTFTTVEYLNTLFAHNSGSNLHDQGGSVNYVGSLVSLGHNLSTDGTGNLIQPTDQPNTEPLLRPLANYGGLVPTHALLPGSPAIDAGLPTSIDGAPAFDARGVPRTEPFDVGAFEAIYSYEIISGNGQVVPAGETFAQPFVARLLENGQPVIGVEVTFASTTVTFGGANSALVVTDANGFATSPLATAGTMPTAGNVTATAGNSVLTFTHVITSGFLAGYEIDPPPDSVIPGQTFFLDVKPVDAFGNPFPQDAGGLIFTSSDPTAILPPPFLFDFDPPGGIYRIEGFALNGFGTQTLTLTPFATGSFSDPTQFSIYVINTNAPTLDVGGDASVIVNQPFVRPGQVIDHQDKLFTVTANFGDGSAPMVIDVAPDGSFVLEHVYANLGNFVVQVQVIDELGREDTKSFTVTAQPEFAPELEIADNDEFGNVGTPFQRAGRVVNGEGWPFTVVVDYGDGTIEQVAVDSDGNFLLNRTYPEEGSFIVRVTLTNGDQVETQEFYADILLAGVPLDTAVKERVNPGATVTVAVPGASVIYENNGNDFSAIIVAVVPVEVAARLNTQFFVSQGLEILSAFDVRAINVSPLDLATVTFSYPFSENETGGPILTFFNRETGRQQRVVSSVFIVDTVNRTITFVLDRRSIPRLRDLDGTVFTICVPVTVSPPATATPTVGTTPTLNFGNLILASLIITNQTGLTFAGNLSTPLDGSSAELLEGGGRDSSLRLLLSGGRISAEEAAAEIEGGPLRELPPVPPVLTDLPSVTVTPAGAEPLSEPPPPPEKTPPTGGNESAEPDKASESEPLDEEVTALWNEDEWLGVATEPAWEDDEPLNVPTLDCWEETEPLDVAVDDLDAEQITLIALTALIGRDSRRGKRNRDDLLVVAGEHRSVGEGWM